MLDDSRFGRWGREHPKSLWQTVALPNFVEGEVIDVAKTEEVLLAFAKLGVNGVYIRTKDNEEMFIMMPNFLDYISKIKPKAHIYGTLKPKYCPLRVCVHRKQCGKTWSLQRAEDDEPTWDLSSYKVSPYLNIQMTKD